jgi:hypothetical protein
MCLFGKKIVNLHLFTKESRTKSQKADERRKEEKEHTHKFKK